MVVIVSSVLIVSFLAVLDVYFLGDVYSCLIGVWKIFFPVYDLRVIGHDWMWRFAPVIPFK